MPLTLDDLAATSGTAAKEVALASKALKAQDKVIAVPVARTTERRAQRELAYETTKKAADQWDATTDAERKVNSLRFGARAPDSTSTSQLASTFYADTPLERRVEQILQRAGAHSEKAVKATEDKALEEVDDADERRNELSKTRSLLFFAERKAKYHARVKSKAYARLRRKRLKRRDEAAKDAAAEADPSLREARDEKEAKDRALERADLRHASTSAWARSTKMRGRGAIESRRVEMRENENVRKELSRKQEDHSDEESDSDESREALIAKARASLGECVEPEEPGGALLNMKFMVKAREAQRVRAREEAQELLEELEADASSDSSDSDDGDLAELAAFSGEVEDAVVVPEVSVALQGNSLKVSRKRGAPAPAPPAPAPPADDGAWLAAARKARARGRAVSKGPVEVELQLPAPATKQVEAAPAAEAPAADAPLTKLSQKDLVHMAFDQDTEADFALQKSEELEPEKGPVVPDMVGWGNWTGRGAPAPRRKRKAPVVEAPVLKGVAANPRVILNPKRSKRACLLKVAQVPYPFTSRSEYERYMARPVGQAWNDAPAVKKLTRPAVSVRAGAAIEPIRKQGGV